MVSQKVELSLSNVVKLEPSAGPTLFLIQTTIDCSTTATAIQIHYCASCTTRAGTSTMAEGISLYTSATGVQGVY